MTSPFNPTGDARRTRVSMLLGPSARSAWTRFLGGSVNRGHTARPMHGDTLDSHVDACLSSAQQAVARIVGDVGDLEVRLALEVGSSTGLNCFALQDAFPDATILGIEPEHEALIVARQMATGAGEPSPVFIEGIGERLPLSDGSVDLIVIHTVIEHVYDVHAVIGEMARVLSARGKIHLEAPNYVWPREPHLAIWCVPLLGKRLLALMARLQGKSELIPFLGHLQLVHPRLLEREFRAFGLRWTNRIETKLQAILGGDRDSVKAYHRVSGLLRMAGRSGAGGLIVRAVVALGLYPSVMYTVSRRPGSGAPR